MNLEKIIVVKKATQLEELLKRHATTSQVKFHLESRGEQYKPCKESNMAYKQSLQQVIKTIPPKMRSQIVDKEDLATFQFGDKDLVITVGDPGLFVNVAKYVGNQPVLVVNPEPERYDNNFAVCSSNDFDKVLKPVLDGKYSSQKLTMAQAKLDDGQILYALNDLFIGRKTHVSARYLINHEGYQENQSSSGIIVSTGTGSTGWRTSVMLGAHTLSNLGYDPREAQFPRDAPYLEFTVREPFPTKTTGTDIMCGKITESLKITSNMTENGVIFSDGIEFDYLEFLAGTTATISPSNKAVYLINGVNN